MAKIHADGRVTDASLPEPEVEIEQEPEVAPSAGNNSDQSEKSNVSTPKKSARTGRNR